MWSLPLGALTATVVYEEGFCNYDSVTMVCAKMTFILKRQIDIITFMHIYILPEIK